MTGQDCPKPPPYTHIGLSCMQEARVPLNEYEFPSSKVANVQSQLEKLVEKNYYLHQSAKDAYRGYILAYNSHQLKDIFNVHTLDLRAVAKSFGFTGPPRVRTTLPPPGRQFNPEQLPSAWPTVNPLCRSLPNCHMKLLLWWPSRFRSSTNTWTKKLI